MISRNLLSLSPITLCFVAVVSFAAPAFAESPGSDRVTTASCQRCGDGYCAPSCENERTCPADCKSTKLAAPAVAPSPTVPAVAPSPAASSAAARCGRCGDGQCVKSCGETATTCPVDCGGGGEPSSASTSTGKPGDCEAETLKDDRKKK